MLEQSGAQKCLSSNSLIIFSKESSTIVSSYFEQDSLRIGLNARSFIVNYSNGTNHELPQVWFFKIPWMLGSKVEAREYLDRGKIWVTVTGEEEENGDESDKRI